MTNAFTKLDTFEGITLTYCAAIENTVKKYNKTRLRLRIDSRPLIYIL